MNIFRPNPKTSAELDVDLKQAKVLEAKAKAQSAVKGSALKGIILAGLSLLVLFFAYNKFQESMECTGVCGVDLNKQIIKEGFAMGESSEDKQGVWVVDYDGMYTQQKSEDFRKKINVVTAVSKPKDILILKINSNGGDSVACATDFAMIQNIKKRFDLNVIAQVERQAHSCGYYLAASSDTILAQQGSSLGNIGVAISSLANPINGLIKKVTGEDKVTIGSTREKELFVGDSVKSEEDVRIIRKHVMTVAFNFYTDVINGRSGRLKEQNYEAAFSAYPFPARQAKALGLVDDLVGFHELLLGYHSSGHVIKQVVIK